MNMQLLDIAVDVFAALGVIATLIYLSVQIKENTQALRSTNNNSAASNSLAILGPMFATAEFSEFLVRVQSNLDFATPAERRRLHVFLLAGFRHWDNLYSQYRKGALDPEIWLSYDRTMRSWMENTSFRHWYEENSSLFSESLQKHLQPRV